MECFRFTDLVMQGPYFSLNYEKNFAYIICCETLFSMNYKVG